MKFERRQIPIEVQEAYADLLDRKEAEMIAELQDPNHRWATACHEAAHGVMRLRAGATRLKFIPPHIVYDAAANTVQNVVAGIDSDFAAPVISTAMALYCAAGYIWEAKLTNVAEQQTEQGAAVDKKRFREDLLRIYGATEEYVEQTWLWAVGEIRKDLDNPEIREDILKLAREFQVWLEEQL